MARSRNLKPGFFKNEDLADLGPEAQLLFSGLWTLADRKGRLEDRPRRIKAELFPFYEVGVGALLEGLSAKLFIVRYQVGGFSYIQINNFEKHQNPHIKEQESTIPAPVLNGASHVNSGTSPADSLNPITDSLNPTTATLPLGLSQKTWDDFKEHRKALKAKLTVNAEIRLLTKLEKMSAQGEDIEAAVSNSIENGWRGVFSPAALSPRSRQTSSKPGKMQRAAEALRRVYGDADSATTSDDTTGAITHASPPARLRTDR